MSGPVLAALPLMAVVGLSLGLLGGGGSILAVPVLVYVARLPPPEAVALSLAVVGTTSLASAVLHARAGRVDVRAVALFGGTGVLAAPLGSWLSRGVRPAVLLLCFAVLMIGVGAALLRGRRAVAGDGRRRAPMLLAAGTGVGALTGFLGVGGGFLIVPALVLLAGLPMATAVGTSLAVITVNAFAALIAHLGTLHTDVTVAAALTVAALAGAWLGARWSARWPQERLRHGFAALVLAVGLLMGADSLIELVQRR